MGDDNVSSSAATFGLHLSSCLRNSRSVWKTPWSNSLLAYDPKPRLPQPLGPLPLLVPSSVPDALSTPSAPHFVRSEGLEQVCAKMAKFKHSSWEVMLNEERNLAVNKWLSLILLEPMAFGVARNFYASKASGIASGSLGDSVSDCLASKATSTINARANSLLRYVSWAKVKLTCIFPLTEHAVYAFFEDRQATAAATSFRSLLSAIAFAQHVVGLEGVTGSTLRVVCVALRQSSTCKSANLSSVTLSGWPTLSCLRGSAAALRASRLRIGMLQDSFSFCCMRGPGTVTDRM